MTKPHPRLSKIGWMDSYSKLNTLSECSTHNILLIGDSLIYGLGRYGLVWERYFKNRHTLNCGIRGNKAVNVLWRSQHMSLSPSLRFIVIHCGTNDLNSSIPNDIALAVLNTGSTFKKRSPKSSIIITGLLPRDINPSARRNKIKMVNFILKEKCLEKGFVFVVPDSGWLFPNRMLNTDLFYKDYLHLVEKGNDKFADSIIAAINLIKSKHEARSFSEISNFTLKKNHFPPLMSSMSVCNASNSKVLSCKSLSVVSSKPILLSHVVTVPPSSVSVSVVQPVLHPLVVVPPNVLYPKVDVVPISVAIVDNSRNVFPAPNVCFVLHSTSAFVNVDVVKVSYASIVTYPTVPNVPTVCPVPNVSAIFCPVSSVPDVCPVPNVCNGSISHYVKIKLDFQNFFHSSFIV